MLFHVSYNPNLNTLIAGIPRVDSSYEENTSIERVCFSDSISGCLSAIWPVCCGPFYVYTPINNIRIFKPTIYDVKDAKFTGEVWSLQDVEVRQIGSIYAKYKNVSKYQTIRGEITVPNFTYEWVNNEFNKQLIIFEE
ncbi:MAG: hypothetical protein M0P49_01825 [Bacilli bacterium]|nr:hypothetical protein [Bacilli bacterium]